jgi:hypothetical protein
MIGSDISKESAALMMEVHIWDMLLSWAQQCHVLFLIHENVLFILTQAQICKQAIFLCIVEESPSWEVLCSIYIILPNLILPIISLWSSESTFLEWGTSVSFSDKEIHAKTLDQQFPNFTHLKIRLWKRSWKLVMFFLSCTDLIWPLLHISSFIW